MTSNFAIRHFGEPITLITRVDSVSASGIETESVETREPRRAVVQPLDNATLQTLEEGQLWSNFRTFFVSGALVDDLARIAWNGAEWTVTRIRAWSDWFSCVGERQGA